MESFQVTDALPLYDEDLGMGHRRHPCRALQIRQQ